MATATAIEGLLRISFEDAGAQVGLTRDAVMALTKDWRLETAGSGGHRMLTLRGYCQLLDRIAASRRPGAAPPSDAPRRPRTSPSRAAT